MEIKFAKEIIELIQVFAIVFALFHMLLGFFLLTRINRMNSIVKTPSSGCLGVIGLLYLAVLIFVVVLLVMQQ